MGCAASVPADKASALPRPHSASVGARPHPTDLEPEPWLCRHHGRALGGIHQAFISYRWASDGARNEANPAGSGMAPALFDALEAAGLSTFWDERCLNSGERLQSSFLTALAGSTLAILVVSRASLERVRKYAVHREDNVLLEWETALDRADTGMGLVLPVYVGDFKTDADAFPDLAHKFSGKSVRATVSNLFSRLYLRLKPRSAETVEPDELAEVVAKAQDLLTNVPDKLQGGKALRLLADQMAVAATERARRDHARYARIAHILVQGNVAGRGASSIVYRGVLDGGPVAIKALAPGKREQSAKQLLNEAAILSSLDSVHLMRCTELVRRGEDLYMIMPLADQGSLAFPGDEAKELLKDGGQLLSVCMGVANGLAYLHASLIVHRDVKPDNVMLVLSSGGDPPSTSLEPLLADLGIARGDISDTVGGTTAAGTTGYMDEQAMHGHVSPKSDVYGFGVMLLVLITGRPPLRTEGKGDTLRHVTLAASAATDGRPASQQAVKGVRWEPPERLEGAFRLALDCTNAERRLRPTAADAAMALADLLSPGGGPSRFYTHREMLTAAPGSEGLVCVVCAERPRATVFAPCKHACACRGCADELMGQGAACPICRSAIDVAKDAPGPVMRTWAGEGLPPAATADRDRPAGDAAAPPPLVVSRPFGSAEAKADYERKWNELKHLGGGDQGIGMSYAVERRAGPPGRFFAKKQSLPNELIADARGRIDRCTGLKKHAGIAAIVEVFYLIDGPIIVTEYGQDGRLSDKLDALGEGTGIPEAEALDIFVQLLMALRHAHASQITHGNVQPTSIFLDGRDIKLGDFFIAERQFFGLETLLWPDHYITPEELDPDVTPDHRQDIWRAACVLYECLAGTKAFGGEDLLFTNDFIRRAQYVPLPSDRCSPDLAVLLNTMLRTDPQERPTIDQLLAAPVVAAAKAAVDARRPGEREPEKQAAPSAESELAATTAAVAVIGTIMAGRPADAPAISDERMLELLRKATESVRVAQGQGFTTMGD